MSHMTFDDRVTITSFIDVKTNLDSIDIAIEYILTQTSGIRQIFKSPNGERLRIVAVSNSEESIRNMCDLILCQLKGTSSKVEYRILGETVKDIYCSLKN